MSRFTFSAVLLLGLCCISQSVFAENQTANNKQQLKDDPILYITAGYSSDQQMATGYRCVNQDPSLFSYQGGSKSVLSLGDLRDFDQLQKDLNVSVAASGGYGMFSSSIDASYARQVEDDNYSEGFSYDEIIQLPTQVYTPIAFGPQMLNSYGQQVEQADTTGQTFRTYCGDQYVIQTPLGARLAVTFKLNFASHSDRQTFDANVDGGMGSIFSASASISSVVKQYNLHGSLSVYALQDGGDASQLAKIFGSPTCSNHYCVSTCDLNNLSACQGVIDGIINYAANDLPTEIDFEDGQIKGSAIQLSYTMGVYPGVKIGKTLVTDAVQQARESLGNIYQQQSLQYAVVNHISSAALTTPYINPNYVQQIQDMVDTLHYNLALLEGEETIDGAAACYQTPAQCIKVYNAIMSRLKPIDQQTYNQFNSAYSLKLPDGYYYDIPLGENNYLQIFRSTSVITSTKSTLTPFPATSSHAEGLHLEEYDMQLHYAYGDFFKQSDGSYAGTFISPNRYSTPASLTVIDNPV